VVRAHGKFFAVQELGGERSYLAEPRGTIKRFRQKTDIVAVGDRVWVTELEDGEARIEAVMPRRSVLQRPARGSAGVQQVILANPDQALFVFAVTQPDPHRRMLDRFLILSAATGVPALIGINKVDLDKDEGAHRHSRARTIFGDYERIYPVFYFSARERIGLDPLAKALDGKLTVIAGPSGVGKSSLLNALDPKEDRATQEISESTGKGRHTTTSAQIYRLGPDTFVADTPGMRALAMRGVDPEQLDRYFPEFRPFLGSCFYADCKHLSEPGCAVIDAVERDEISLARYESYSGLRTGEPD
jgi:ribosome biogenesis GTPase / thiamine phosphate phosphatase